MKILILLFNINLYLIIGCTTNLNAQVLSDEYILKILDQPLKNGFCGFDFGKWDKDGNLIGFMTLEERGESIFRWNRFDELAPYGNTIIPQILKVEKYLKNSPEKLITALGILAEPEDEEAIRYLEQYIKIFGDESYKDIALRAIYQIEAKAKKEEKDCI